MILWFAPNTCARVALTALEEIGEPFETRLVAFMAGEHREPEFLAVNPWGKVPALETPEGTLTQNGAILSYLHERHGAAGLLPVAEGGYARARQLAELFRFSADLHPLVTRFVMPQMMSAEVEDAPRIRETAAEALRFQLRPLAARLEQQEWLLGESWSILDAYCSWIWFRISGSGFPEEDLPVLGEHYRRAMKRPSAQAALAREAQAEEALDRRGLLFRPPFHEQKEGRE